MKFIIKTAVILLLPFCCLAGDGYVIKGKISGVLSGYVTITERTEEGVALIHDQLPERVRIVEGEFTISGKVLHPGVVDLKVSTRTVRILLENTAYTVNSTLQTLSGDQFTGGTLNDQYYEYQKSQGSPLDFVKKFPAKPISAYLAYAFTREYQEVQNAYTVLSPENKASYFGQQVGERLAKFKTTEAGKNMPDFSMTAPDGTQFSVKDLAGKVVVLDFWASWCAPCRNFIPTMREYYNQYHEKGVEFVAVSLDEHSDKWRQAMAETKMEWKQGLAEGGFGNDAPIKNLLNIKSIPHVIVIGKDGKIAAWLDFSMKSQLPEILARLNP
ncbi:TlpA disulfide reductase family protein [Chitinophaga sp.]|uniref:TlpA disulfide reductase family protein n=1 Tax=Chitinophaga sp. TaxID=1869181 RepID=UPI002F930F0C